MCEYCEKEEIGKELDIPIKNIYKQFELGICMECGKKKSKIFMRLCNRKNF